jgi:hypothetical protein
MNDDELLRMQQEVEDEVSRRREQKSARPPWRVALDELCMANAENPDFWRQLWAVIGAAADDDDLKMAARFYAKRCRICGRPMHKTHFQCDHCCADNYGPEVIKGAVTAVAVEIES